MRKEGLELRLDTERASARSAGPVRCREGLVHVDVDTVEAEIARTRDAEERVHVRAVAVHKASGVVHRVAHLT